MTTKQTFVVMLFFYIQNWIKGDECHINPIIDGYALTHTVNTQTFQLTFFTFNFTFQHKQKSLIAHHSPEII